MSRPKNENNVYELTCKVTGSVIKTNPKQANNDMTRYGVDRATLVNSYVSRQGRNVIAAEKLTVAEAVAKYGLDEKVASFLKCTVKPTVVAVTPDAPITVEVAPDAAQPSPVAVEAETAPETSPVEDEALVVVG